MKQKDAAKEAMIEYIKELAAENLYNFLISDDVKHCQAIGGFFISEDNMEKTVTDMAKSFMAFYKKNIYKK